jgi:benzoylformate decarboxylase
VTQVANRLVEILRAAGVDYLFGNPGTTELPFLDALDGSGLTYVVALQEASAAAAADGYAQASGRLGVVNLHVAPGLANALSIVHNASRAKTPLLVTAGQQDTRLLLDAPILAGDMVSMSEGLTKWSHEVRSAAEAPAALRRAIHTALSPPTGPVFLSLPMDLMTEPCDDAGGAPTPVSAPPAPEPEAVARAAALLAAAAAPVIVAGDGVARAGAQGELRALAETLGAAVHGEPIHRRLSFPGDHALWRGGLYPTATGVARALERFDAVLIVGANAFTWLFHAPGSPFRAGQSVIHLDDDAREIGRSYPVTLGIVGDVRAGLAALRASVAGRQDPAARAAARERGEILGRTRDEHARRTAAAADAARDRAPIAPEFLMRTLGALLPKDALIVDESASSLAHVLRHLPFAAGSDFFGSKTGTLGWAMGAALGVQLAHPGRKVVATIGDGSVMYAPQALWTAAHYGLPVTYVVANNASYAILKSGMLGFGLPNAKRGVFPGMDLVSPEIDYLALARSMGVTAERVDKPGALRDALARALGHPGPALVDVAIDRGYEPMR